MKSITLKKFGKNIRAIRERNNLSQEALADLTGLHRTYIGSMERGERNISVINIVKIAKALKCTPKDIFKGLI